MKKLFNLKFLIGIIIFLIIVFFSGIVSLLVDFQWFKEVGYTGVFTTRLFTQFKLGIPIFVILAGVIYLYLQYLKSEYIKNMKVIHTKEQVKSINFKLFLASLGLSLISSFTLSSTYWYEILSYINGADFNLKDPIFNKDVSFFIFRLPLYQALYGVVFGILILLMIITVIFCLFLGIRQGLFELNNNMLRFDRRRGLVFGKEVFELAGRQLAAILSLILVMIGISYILRNYSLVYSPRGVAFGASYTDVHVTLLFNRILAVLSIISAAALFLGLFKKNLKLTLIVVGVMIGANLIQGLLEAGVDRFIVSPNEKDKEQQFINYNIKYTRLGYGLDNIEEKDYLAEVDLSPEDIEENRNTIKDIRINDFAPALEVYNQLQGIRNYYRFNDIDIDRYKINGDYTQVFIAPREIDLSKLDQSSITWLNKHLIYTHGYGVAMSPVNTVTAQGQPNLIIKDIPPVSTVDLQVERPEIYFGELTNDYIVVNNKITKEMDYPLGDTNAEAVYQGKAGISLGGLNRLLFMIDRGSFNFLLSQDINSKSKIILHRNVVERANKIAPFLVYDKDPYIVLNEGKLYWILDAYTISSGFPYSELYMGINYIRNSVKVIIDAYDGTTDFYLADENDPLAVTYSRVFPGLFKSLNEMPQGFKEHFRYPQDIFSIQAEVYKKYHMTNAGVFYNREDMWAIPGESNVQEQQTKAEPLYLNMKLPEEEKEEFILMTPFTPSGKDNMVAWLGARSEGEHYGKLILYKFPKQKMTYGPMQFKARVNQDSTISKELALWDQQGSSVLQGNVIIVPIEESLIYVMPVYIRSTGTNSIPEMKRVVLGYGEKIVMEETLDKALQNIFDMKIEDTAPQVPEVNEPPIPDSQMEDLILKANEAFNKAKEAQQMGDWAEYGIRLDELQSILNEMNQSVQSE
ncbi:hypothetical protein OXPF_34180 [Oxobacter pfennigii]|uniref:UPF0182 protein OXPF_34180 n=1 Tax=Oxobacter pfennigii TaxID=36849 RepID=A0A0P8Y8F5_9CLOT|nr:UPF0182 family protein [Oxobacter pfennigii]KPU42987.1 hypothetical protein OXPF_34180 [Oxobacter pfennigii]